MEKDAAGVHLRGLNASQGHLAKGTWHLPWAPGEEWLAGPLLGKGQN